MAPGLQLLHWSENSDQTWPISTKTDHGDWPHRCETYTETDWKILKAAVKINFHVSAVRDLCLYMERTKHTHGPHCAFLASFPKAGFPVLCLKPSAMLARSRIRRMEWFMPILTLSRVWQPSGPNSPGHRASEIYCVAIWPSTCVFVKNFPSTFLPGTLGV